MKDTIPGGLRGAIQAINRFFFEPSDTATLGLIRICAGFLVLYVHLIYSYDLYRLFGKDAWLSHDLVEETRKDYPITNSQTDWQEQKVELPPLANEREAKRLAAYKRKWLAQPMSIRGSCGHAAITSGRSGSTSPIRTG